MNNQLQSWLPILSLAIAALAVFVGPYISWLVSKRQAETSIRVSNKQIIAPMRQAWINNLRDLTAELMGKCAHYFAAGFEDREDSEYRHITELTYKLELYINPNEEDHAQLVSQIKRMESALTSGSNPKTDNEFWEAHRAAIELSHTILKREWDRVKTEI